MSVTLTTMAARARVGELLDEAARRRVPAPTRPTTARLRRLPLRVPRQR
jgi:hypothetical protein